MFIDFFMLLFLGIFILHYYINSFDRINQYTGTYIDRKPDNPILSIGVLENSAPQSVHIRLVDIVWLHAGLGSYKRSPCNNE